MDRTSIVESAVLRKSAVVSLAMTFAKYSRLKTCAYGDAVHSSENYDPDMQVARWRGLAPGDIFFEEWEALFGGPHEAFKTAFSGGMTS